MILRDALEGRLDDPLYAVVFVTNAIETVAELVRGIVVKQIPVDISMEDVEPRGAFFGDLNKAVQEYENLSDSMICLPRLLSTLTTMMCLVCLQW